MNAEDDELLADASARYVLDAACKREPYAFLARLRDEAPVHRSNAGIWLVSDFETASEVLRDDQRFGREAAARHTAEVMFGTGPAVEAWLAKIVSHDGPDHHRLRRLVQRAFTPAAVGAWEKTIEDLVRERLDELDTGSTAELVSSYCYPIPERVICTMLGVPHEDHALFEEWTEVINRRTVAGPGSDEQREAAAAAVNAFTAYAERLIADRRGDARDDLLTQLMQAEEEGDRLSTLEFTTVVFELIAGAHDTTANLIANAILMLLSDRNRFERLRADISQTAAFVEEVLRMRSPVQLSLTRMTTEDVELKGVKIPRGEIVAVALAAANRDGAVFEDAETFRPDRPHNRHLSFGHGVHFCLGAWLARLEVRLAIEGLVQRFPGLRLAVSVDDLDFRDSTMVIGPTTLPVTW